MAGGDREANLKLAHDRARVVAERLVALGISQNRVQTRANPSANHGHGRSVLFRLMQRSF